MTIIGLSGYARSGKDSVAEVLVTNEGYERRAFADTLRNSLLALNPTLMVGSGIGGGLEPWPLAAAVRVYGWEKLKSIAPDSRAYLQRLGTEVGRNILGENIWVDATLPSQIASQFEDIVVTDCRFPNEAAAIKSRGGKLVRVTRPEVGPANDHPSEVGLDDYPFDYFLDNDGDLSDLVDEVQTMLQFFENIQRENTQKFLDLLSS